MASLMKKLQQKAKNAAAPQESVDSDASQSVEEVIREDKQMVDESAEASDEQVEGEINEVVNI